MSSERVQQAKSRKYQPAEAILCVLCRRPNSDPRSSACPECIPPEEGEIRLQGKIAAIQAELEMTADKLSDVWIHLDAFARGEPFTPEMAKSILRHQKAPGWKS